MPSKIEASPLHSLESEVSNILSRYTVTPTLNIWKKIDEIKTGKITPQHYFDSDTNWLIIVPGFLEGQIEGPTIRGNCIGATRIIKNTLATTLPDCQVSILGLNAIQKMTTGFSKHNVIEIKKGRETIYYDNENPSNGYLSTWANLEKHWKPSTITDENKLLCLDLWTGNISGVNTRVYEPHTGSSIQHAPNNKQSTVQDWSCNIGYLSDLLTSTELHQTSTWLNAKNFTPAPDTQIHLLISQVSPFFSLCINNGDSRYLIDSFISKNPNGLPELVKALNHHTLHEEIA